MPYNNSNVDEVLIRYGLRLCTWPHGTPGQFGKIEDVDGKQLIRGKQGAAISDASTDSEKIQAILDRLREHGLIASE